MCRRSLVTVLVLLLASPALAAGAARRPNVVILLPDQWRACATGYAGDVNVKTPNLDQLAGESVNFVNAVSTCPVCTPMRASLLTGQRPTTHGLFLNDVHLADDAVTMAKLFDAAGYDTAYVGKWHVNGGGRSAYIPPENRQGFAFWRALECTHDYNRSPYYADGVERLMWPGYDGFAQTRVAVDYVKAHAAAEKPFCLVLAWGPPHNPYATAPKQFAALYDPAKIVLRPNVPPDVQDKTRADLAGYYAHCSALDKCVGDVRQALADAGIADDTILVFTSDHGDMLGSQGTQRKQRPWDESIRVPMLWHYPAGLGGGTLGGGALGRAAPGKGARAIDTPMASEDILPTLLGLCGIAAPPGVEGLNYAPYLTDPASPNPNADGAALIECVAPFGEWTRAQGGREYRGLRTPRYTYVRDLSGPWLLYDDVADPYQERNLANAPEAAAVQERLDALLAARLKAAHDEFLPGEKYIAKWGYAVDKNGTVPYRN